MRHSPSFPDCLRLLLFLGLAGTGPVATVTAAPEEAKTAPRAALTVTTIAPRSEVWPETIRAGGALFAWRDLAVAAQVGGLAVVEMPVEVGSVVHRGDLLARLAQDSLKALVAQKEAEVARARAALEEAVANGERARKARGGEAFSEQKIVQYLVAEKSAKAAVAVAEAALRVEEVRLAQTEFRAFADGVITARGVTLGSVVPVGAELFRILVEGRVEWRAELVASQLAAVHPGQAVEVRPASGGSITGRVRVVAPTLDAATRKAIAYVDLPADSGARPGMFAQGTITVGERPALSVPQSAVVFRDGHAYLFGIDPEERVVRHKVTIGRHHQGRVEILGAPPELTRVVATGGAFLNQGDRVRVVSEAAPASPDDSAVAIATPADTLPGSGSEAPAGTPVTHPPTAAVDTPCTATPTAAADTPCAAPPATADPDP
ncbi:MAG: efflux RND transporter periplasmic adaptor subunit [Magnetococcales bacterium]|nr:efflux RND transporter periplasmic adaptor subunit [Magnetococcales bacterium]MBF0157266.1 efflux RND transporter periplasmic adaptor subunit [Magnetococcales bacterium]